MGIKMTILDEIAGRARERVEVLKREKSADLIRQEAEALGRNTGFPFRKALSSPGISFICEVKKSLSFQRHYCGGIPLFKDSPGV